MALRDSGRLPVRKKNFIAKTEAGIESAMKKAQAAANRTGRSKTVFVMRPKYADVRFPLSKHWYADVHPNVSNPGGMKRPKLGQWVKAHRVRLVKRNGATHVEIQRTVAKKRKVTRKR